MTYLKVDGENVSLEPFEDCKTCEGDGFVSASSVRATSSMSNYPCPSCKSRHIRHLKKKGKKVEAQ